MARWNYERCCWLDNDGTPLVDYEPAAQDYAKCSRAEVSESCVEAVKVDTEVVAQ
jgi:hypothetical protein